MLGIQEPQTVALGPRFRGDEWSELVERNPATERGPVFPV